MAASFMCSVFSELFFYTKHLKPSDPSDPKCVFRLSNFFPCCSNSSKIVIEVTYSIPPFAESPLHPPMLVPGPQFENHCTSQWEHELDERMKSEHAPL